MKRYGDAKLPELRHIHANCLKAIVQHDQCKVVYVKDSRSSTPGPLKE
jgi:hypothetical protein